MRQIPGQYLFNFCEKSLPGYISYGDWDSVVVAEKKLKAGHVVNFYDVDLKMVNGKIKIVGKHFE